MSWLTFSLVANDASTVWQVFAFSMVAALLAFRRRPSPLVVRPEVVR